MVSVVSDTTRYERWKIYGVIPGAAPWKGSRTRLPVIDETPRDGKRISSPEQYLIDIALKPKEMDLKIGDVGDGVIKDAQEALQPMRSREDFFLKTIANLAYDGWAVPDASAEDLKMTRYDILEPSTQILSSRKNGAKPTMSCAGAERSTRYSTMATSRTARSRGCSGADGQILDQGGPGFQGPEPPPSPSPPLGGPMGSVNKLSIIAPYLAFFGANAAVAVVVAPWDRREE